MPQKHICHETEACSPTQLFKKYKTKTAKLNNNSEYCPPSINAVFCYRGLQCVFNPAHKVFLKLQLLSKTRLQIIHVDVCTILGFI